MKKFLLITLSVLVLLIGLLVAGSLTYLNRIVKEAVHQIGPRVLQVPVTLTDVNIRPFAGKAVIEGLVIGNPEGFETDHLFALGKLDLAIDLKSLRTDTVRIHHIKVSEPDVTFEKTLTSSNLKALMNQLEEDSPAADPTGEEPAASSAKTVVIEKLRIEDGTVRVLLPGMMGQAAPIPLPLIELENIGETQEDEEGVTIASAVGLVLNTILGTTLEALAGAGELLGDGVELLGDGTLAVGKGVLEGAGAVGGVALEGAEDVGQAAEAGVEAITDVASDSAKAAADVGRKALGSLSSVLTRSSTESNAPPSSPDEK